MEFRRVRATELSEAIGLILSAERIAEPAQINEFLQFAPKRRIDPTETFVAAWGGQIIYAGLPVFSPGKTVLILVPAQIPTLGTNVATRVVLDICENARGQRIDLAQVLIDPEREELRGFFKIHHFVEMAELIYLHTNVPKVSHTPQLPTGFAWKTYSPATHKLFAEAILDSYRQSLDCPGLNGLRDIEDVIAGHMATGEFQPELWGMLCENEHPRGVLLLNRVPMADSLEVTYLGLSPESRGRGFGDLFLRQAFFLCGQTKCRRLTLAVDSTNHPALKLYFRHGMRRIARKVAMMRDLRKG